LVPQWMAALDQGQSSGSETKRPRLRTAFIFNGEASAVRFQTTLFVSERFCRSLQRKPRFLDYS
jgi:hypothetical protein